MVRTYLLLFLFLLLCQAKAFANFNYDTNCVDAYKAILSLRINDAKLLIQKEKQQNPQNGITILLDNYVDYFSLFTSENRADYEKLKDNKSKRISALEENDSSSPYYLFAQAEIYLQWAFLKARFGDFVSSAFDAKKANGLLKENAEKFPEFLPNQMSLALVNFIFGAIPANFRSVTRFLGMNGNMQAGLKQLEDIRLQLPKTKYSFYSDEVIFFICTTNIDGLRNYNAYPRLINYLAGIDANSLLKSFLQGYIAAKTAHNDDAIAYFEASPKTSAYVNFPYINYLLGCAKLNRMDSDANIYLNNFLKDFRGVNYIKDAYLKLAYFYLLKNDPDKYEYYLKLVRSRGNNIDQKDKQALQEANDAKPDIDLLKARFYFDGGYYNKALDQLKNKEANNLKLLRDKIELYYRLGRIYDRSGKPNEAVTNYQQAINLGKASSYYFASTAAVNAGRIFEEKKDFKRAADYFNQALEMKNHEYQDDSDNDAKAGLKRMGL